MVTRSQSDPRFDKCEDCEHARAEHGDPGKCECIVIAMGGEYTCNCKRFVEADGYRFWRCRRCGYEHHEAMLDLENPPCPCGSQSVWVVARKAAA